MKIFFDTEFTGLHKNTTLISIGLVDEFGYEFYGEFTDYDESQCDDWIKENVIAHLTGNKTNNTIGINGNIICTGDKKYVREALERWLFRYEEIELVSDVCHYDMVLFIDLWGGAFDIPKNINAACHDINQDIATHFNISETEAFDLSREGIIDSYNEKIKIHWADNQIKIKGDKHNSLYDAKVIKEIYNIINIYKG